MEQNTFIGNEGILRDLHERTQRGLLPAALLLTGPAHIGKTTLLDIVARTLLCETRSACGVCVSCATPLHLHPDLRTIDVREEEDVRKALAEATAQLSQRPLLGPVRILRVLSFEQASDASHALFLKTIEDMPSSSFIFFTAALYERVPATIRSRVFHRTLLPPSEVSLVHYLSLQGVDASRSSTLARLAAGRPGVAHLFTTHPEHVQEYKERETFFMQLSTQSYAKRLEALRAYTEREKAVEFLFCWQWYLLLQLKETLSLKRETSVSLLHALRRSKDAFAMLSAYVPPQDALSYVFLNASL